MNNVNTNVNYAKIAANFKRNVINEHPNNTLKKMLNANGSESWGNMLVSNNNLRPRNNAEEEIAWSDPAMNAERNALRNYNIPDLTDPLQIMEHFPVNMVRLDDADYERFAVVFDSAKHNMWRNNMNRTPNRNMHNQYDIYMGRRLIAALEAHPGIYELSPARTAEQIIVLRLLPIPQEDVTRALARSRLPITWRRLEGVEPETVVIELHRGRLAGANESAARAEVMAFLNAVEDFHVEAAAGPRELARLVRGPAPAGQRAVAAAVAAANAMVAPRANNTRRAGNIGRNLARSGKPITWKAVEGAPTETWAVQIHRGKLGAGNLHAASANIVSYLETLPGYHVAAGAGPGEIARLVKGPVRNRPMAAAAAAAAPMGRANATRRAVNVGKNLARAGLPITWSRVEGVEREEWAIKFHRAKLAGRNQSAASAEIKAFLQSIPGYHLEAAGAGEVARLVRD
jgi:hypothetical protein